MSMKYQIVPDCQTVEAMRYLGDLASLRKVAEFTGVEAHDVYHVATDWGVQCMISPVGQESVRLYPGNYLVKTSEGKIFSVPLEGFEKIYKEAESSE